MLLVLNIRYCEGRTERTYEVGLLHQWPIPRGDGEGCGNGTCNEHCRRPLVAGFIWPGLKALWLQQEYARTIFRKPRSPTVVPFGHYSTNTHVRAGKQPGGFMLGKSDSNHESG